MYYQLTKSSYMDSLKILEADIEHANGLWVNLILSWFHFNFYSFFFGFSFWFCAFRVLMIKFTIRWLMNWISLNPFRASLFLLANFDYWQKQNGRKIETFLLHILKKVKCETLITGLLRFPWERAVSDFRWNWSAAIWLLSSYSFFNGWTSHVCFQDILISSTYSFTRFFLFISLYGLSFALWLVCFIVVFFCLVQVRSDGRWNLSRYGRKATIREFYGKKRLESSLLQYDCVFVTIG